MSQDRALLPSHAEVIEALQKELAGLMDEYLQEQQQIEGVEEAIMTDGDVQYDPPVVLQEESMKEVAYEKVAPYIFSALTFLKHVLDNNKEVTDGVKKQLHELLQMSHVQFKELSAEAQRKYLLDISVISYAILQDLRVLANKYLIEIDLCLNVEILMEITKEIAINGATTILFDKPYHPDHQKEFAAYRQRLYTSISSVDMSIHEFFTIMHGHVAAAMEFVKQYKPDIKRSVVEQEKKEPTEQKEQTEQKGQEKKAPILPPLTRAISQTLMPPPAAAPAPATPAVDPVPARRGMCVIL